MVRLIGSGMICPSTSAHTRCSYGRHCVNRDRKSATFGAFVWKMWGP